MQKTKPHEPQYYRDYLGLKNILNAQQLMSDEYGEHAHDEMLFIIIHQTYELWFKQILFEVGSILDLLDRPSVDEKAMGLIVHRIKRVTEIEKILIDQIRILETMTPLDFLDFRDFLSPASGFQSLQFRLLEIKMGLPDHVRLNYNNQPFSSRMDAEDIGAVQEAMKYPSMFQLVEKWLERTPFLNLHGYSFWDDFRKAVDRMLENDRLIIVNNPTLSEEEIEHQRGEWNKTVESFTALFDEEKHNTLVKSSQRRLSFKATQSALFISLYRDQPILHLPFLFLEALVDMDELLSSWRYRHALMVLRMIGTKIGTGGSSGYAYLVQTAMKHKVFQDLAAINTYLIPRKELPELPEELEKNLGFHWGTESQ